MDQQISNELPPVQMPEQNQQLGSSPTEAMAMPSHSEAVAGQAIEQGRSAPQANPHQQTSGVLPQPPANPLGATALPQTTNMPAIADDTDLIEKEWVVKAKDIIARTLNDPYQQNKEVERVKAEYLKKRYNKDLKLTED